MPFNFVKKTAPPAATPSAPSTTNKPSALPAQGSSPPKKAGGFSFLKRGADARETVKKEEHKADLQKESYGKMFRFWMNEDTERKITFLDGDLDADGLLDVTIGYEHRIKLNGRSENFMCTADTDKSVACPLCERGDSPSTMMVYLTVIDHTPYTVQSGKNQGKVISNSRKLFACKKTTHKTLMKQAAKRGGLVGCTFDVSRGGDKSAAVGDTFEFVEKQSLEELAAKYNIPLTDVQPADYENELSYRTPDELIELGVGKKPSGIGYESGMKDKSKSDLASEL
jgi:hypothetical protein